MVKSLTFFDLQQDLEAGKIGPAYIFAGAEMFLKRTAGEELKRGLFPHPDALSMNYNVFYPAENGLDDILDTARTSPFLGERRLVVVKNAEALAPEEPRLSAFLANLPPKTVFILETEKTLQDKFVKKLLGHAVGVQFSPLEGVDLERWVGAYAQKRGKKIAPGGVSLLVEKIGNELDGIVNALEKMIVFSGDAKTITERDIESLVKKTHEDTRFAFLNALMARNVSRALIMVSELSHDRKNAADIIGLINWQFKRLENVKNLAAQGYSEAAIAQQLRISPYAARAVSRHAAHFSSREIQNGFQLLLDSDVAIKQGQTSAALALETLVVRLCLKRGKLS